jgi:hypothetical protein
MAQTSFEAQARERHAWTNRLLSDLVYESPTTFERQHTLALPARRIENHRQLGQNGAVTKPLHMRNWLCENFVISQLAGKRANPCLGERSARRLRRPLRILDVTLVGGNRMTLETMIANLSREEKLATMELIWRDLAADSRSFGSPAWHEKVIEDRLENPASGPALSLAEAKDEIKEAINARRASG